MTRFGADHSWETAIRRAGRLAPTGLSLSAGIEGVRVHAGRDGTLDVLEEPDEFQIVVSVPWDERRLDDSAAAIRAVLSGPAQRWPARWHSIRALREDPPPYAGPSWRPWDP